MIELHNPMRPAPMSALVVGGDWACAEGDLGTLAHDCELLAACLAEPLRRDLLGVAHLCHDDSDLAIERWCQIRDRVRALLYDAPVELAAP